MNPSVLCSRNFSVAKKFMDISGGVSRFSVEHFLIHSAENFRRGEHFSVSLISGMENVWVRGGVSKISVENYLSHSVDRPRKGTLWCFAKFGYRKRLCFRGLCHDFRFPVEIFLSHSAEMFRR